MGYLGVITPMELWGGPPKKWPYQWVNGAIGPLVVGFCGANFFHPSYFQGGFVFWLFLGEEMVALKRA